jgi:hypothetical protein
MDEEKFKEFIAMLAATNMKREQDKAVFMPIAKHTKMWYDCFKEVGFDNDQAFTLTDSMLCSMMDNAGTKIFGGPKNG